MLLPFNILEIFSISEMTSQIPINFHTKLGKVELLISFDREMMPTRKFYQLIIIKRGSYRRTPVF